MAQYNSDGALEWKHTYKYDANNLIIEDSGYKFTEAFGGQEIKIDKIVYEYEYYE